MKITTKFKLYGYVPPEFPFTLIIGNKMWVCVSYDPVDVCEFTETVKVEYEFMKIEAEHIQKNDKFVSIIDLLKDAQ